MNKYIVVIGCAIVMAVLATVLLKSMGTSSGFVIRGLLEALQEDHEVGILIKSKLEGRFACAANLSPLMLAGSR